MNLNVKDLFGLIVRSFGLYMLYTALSYLYSFAYYAFPGAGLSTYDALKKPSNPVMDIVAILVYAAIGVYFLFGAPHIVRFSYPEPHKNDSATTNSNDNASI
jgi:hypothetical protein